MNSTSLTKRTILAFTLIVLASTSLVGGSEDECMRGKPYPVFSKNLPEIRSRRFSFKSDHEATERVQLKSGDVIHVRHWGCEYYVITFRFESAEILKGGMSKVAAFKEAVPLLRRMQKMQADSVFDLGLAAITLEKALAKPSNQEFGEQFPVEGDGTDFLQTQVKIDGAGRKGKIGFIEISFLKGPL